MGEHARLTFEEQMQLSEEEEMVEFWRKHPIEAQKTLIGYNLNWFQRIMLRNFWFKTFCLWVQGRGCSKTFMMAVCFVLWALLNPNWQIGIVAPVFRQANFVFDEIDKIYQRSKFVQASCRGPISRTMERSILRFANGSSIEALPLGDGTKVRGRRYRILGIDEFAQTPEPIIKQVVYPFLIIKLRGESNKLLRASSAYWQHNHLWPLYVKFRIKQIETPDVYAVTEFNFKDILADTENTDYQVDMDMIAEMSDQLTNDEFAMEMLAKFPQGSMGFFSADLLDSCIRKAFPIEVEPVDGDPKADYVMGIDVARQQDNFAIVLLKLVGNKKHVVRVIAHNRITFQHMVSIIREICDNYNVVRIVMDQDGGGTAIRDLLADPVPSKVGKNALPILEVDADINEDGLKMLHLVKASMPINERMYYRSKAEMEHSNVIFPVDIRSDPNPYVEAAAREIILLKTEMGVVQEEETMYGKRFVVPKKYHKDRVSAYVMAVTEACDYLTFAGAGNPDADMSGIWV